MAVTPLSLLGLLWSSLIPVATIAVVAALVRVILISDLGIGPTQD